MSLRDALFRLLRGLPLVRFALMLGGGVVATVFCVWLIALLGHGLWPTAEAVAIARIQGLTWIALGFVALIAVVFIALAFGKLDRLKVMVGGNEVDLDFDDKD